METTFKTFGMLELYLDYLDMNLSEYLSQAIKTEMDVCVSKTIGPSKKETKEQRECSQINSGLFEASTSTTDSEFDSDDDSKYDSNKSIDYLSPSKEELIELRNRMCHTPTMAKT
ncbi:hypothetical protein Tco_0720741 [Tanacetum coccineum]